MGYIAENVRRFFHPAAIDEMLSTFLPTMNCTELNVSDGRDSGCSVVLTPRNRVF